MSSRNRLVECVYICVSPSATVKHNDSIRAEGVRPVFTKLLSSYFHGSPSCVCVCARARVRLTWQRTVIALKVNWPQAEHLFLQIDIKGLGSPSYPLPWPTQDIIISSLCCSFSLLLLSFLRAERCTETDATPENDQCSFIYPTLCPSAAILMWRRDSNTQSIAWTMGVFTDGIEFKEHSASEIYHYISVITTMNSRW